MRIRDEVLTVLQTAVPDGDCLKIPGQLDPRVYGYTDTVLRAAGGRWNRARRAHVFPGDAGDVLDTMLQTGEVTRYRTLAEACGYYPTPAPVLARLLQLAQLPETPCRILEPSAGRGAIARAVAALGHQVECVELIEEHAAELRRDGFAVTRGDFLTQPARPEFDRVLMNPPFGRQADIHHVTHAHRFLRPGGLLVAVMAESINFRTNGLTTSFRALISQCGGQVEPLPEGSFRSEGTDAHTVLLTLPAGGS